MGRVPNSRRARALLCVPALALILSACGDAQGELQAWMEQQRLEIKPNVKPIEPPKKFDPQAYETGASVEPFSRQKLMVALRQDAQQPNSLLAAELNRRREPLEAYPLDNMTMVGSVVRQGEPQALLRVDKLLYQVRVGSYLGQNYGRITQITETEIALREIVQDGAGEWIERVVNLQLQEQAR